MAHDGHGFDVIARALRQLSDNTTMPSSPTSSLDRETNNLGPLPDLYQVATAGVSVGFLVNASVIVLLMQLG